MKPISTDIVIRVLQQPDFYQQLTELEWQSVILVLRKHQLLARLANNLLLNGSFESLPEFVKRHLSNAQVLAEKQNNQVFYEAELLQKQLKNRSKFLVYLKGAGYALSRRRVSKGRTYSDLDVLVKKSDMEQVERLLNFNMWFPEELSAYDENYYRKWTHEIPPLRHSQRGTILDLHHNIVPLVSGVAPDIGYFLAEVETTLEGHQVLKPHAMVLHSAIHLFLNEDYKNGFRDLSDIDLLIKEFDSEEFWSSLSLLAKKTGFERELFLALRYCKKIMGTEISERIYGPLLALQSKYVLMLWDYVFLEVLTPNHSLLSDREKPVAQMLAFVRGHNLKMPIHILLYHSGHKLYVSVLEYIFGKGYFLKEQNPK